MSVPPYRLHTPGRWTLLGLTPVAWLLGSWHSAWHTVPGKGGGEELSLVHNVLTP